MTPPEVILRALPDEFPGPRVLVRPYRPGDGAAMWDAIEESREHLRPWMPWVEEHACPDDSERFVRRAQARWLARESLMTGIWSRSDGTFLGSSGLESLDWDTPSFEVGYWLRPSQQGHGYATETVRLMCRLAFETLGAARLFLRCDVRNARSAAVARRAGFVQEAMFRNESRDPRGELRDMVFFAMVREDYETARSAWTEPAGSG